MSPIPSPRVEWIGKRTVRLVDWWSVRTSLGTLTVRPGATSDGTSTPSWMWSIPGLSAFDGATFPASFAHDQLYAAELVERKVADELFHELLRKSGVGWFRSGLLYRAARDFGGIVWRRHTPESITMARWHASWAPAGGVQ